MKNAGLLAAWWAALDQSCGSTLSDSRPSLGRGVPRSAIEGLPLAVNQGFGCAKERGGQSPPQSFGVQLVVG